MRGSVLRKWFARRPKLTVESARLPEGVRIYAIGDIHGRVDLLTRLHKAILADARTVSPETELVAVYLGDYVDRGLQSREVIDLLLDEPLPGFTAVHLCGNHDQQFLQFLLDPGAATGWLRIGGDSTVYSYGVRMPDEAGSGDWVEQLWLALRKAVPPRHVGFLRGLKLSYERGDYLFVHAGIDPEKTLSEQTERDLLWIRGQFLDWDGDFGRVVVHGHSMSDAPEVRENRIGIDTGACYTNRLTCLILEGMDRRFLMTDFA